MLKLSVIAISSIALAGCSIFSSQHDQSDNMTSSEDTEKHYYKRYYEVIHEDTQNYGAGLREPGYVHVLNARPELMDSDSNVEKNVVYKNALNKTLNNKVRTPYSFYDLERWSKYCNEGQGLTLDDWKKIDDLGVSAMPDDIANGCNPPKVNYQTIRKAVSDFCMGSLQAAGSVPKTLLSRKHCTYFHNARAIDASSKLVLSEQLKLDTE